MKTTSTIASELPPPSDGKKKKGKKPANRRIKLQNTHLKELGIDLSKDFVKPGTGPSGGGGPKKK
jgi:transcription initiation factor TFIIE subunit beta